MKSLHRWPLFIITTFIMTIISPHKVSAQNKTQYIRIAKIIVDASRLEDYKAALKEGIEAAIGKEPGVLTLYAVYDKEQPTHITVFEIYADEEAYKSHIQTSHFKKYKDTVKDMVKSLELADVVPIALETKPKS